MKLKTLAGYAASGVFSFVVDIALFALLDKNVFSANVLGVGSHIWSFLRTFGAAGIARIISSIINFAINKLYVFKKKGGTVSSAGKYTVIAVLVYFASSFSVSLLRQVLPTVGITFIKVCVDGFLALVNFVAQNLWVFGANQKN